MKNIGFVDNVRISVIADNRVKDPRLIETWGLSFHITVDSHKILFDTNSDFNILKHNADNINVALDDIEYVVISHWHHDHVGGLNEFLDYLLSRGNKPKVIVPPRHSISKEFIQARDPLKLFSGVITTGTLYGPIEEQGLILNLRGKGGILLVGCSHPGVRNMLTAVTKVLETDNVYAIIGGYHIGLNEVTEVIKALEEYHVMVAGPCHCTDEEAIKAIAIALKDRYCEIYTGRELNFSSED